MTEAIHEINPLEISVLLAAAASPLRRLAADGKHWSAAGRWCRTDLPGDPVPLDDKETAAMLQLIGQHLLISHGYPLPQCDPSQAGLERVMVLK